MAPNAATFDLFATVIGDGLLPQDRARYRALAGCYGGAWSFSEVGGPMAWDRAVTHVSIFADLAEVGRVLVANVGSSRWRSYLALHAAVAPKPVALRDPCKLRPLPQTGGLQGFVQDRVLELLDTTACRAGSTREELVLAIADSGERKRYKARYGVDPKSLSSLLQSLLG